MPITFTLSAPAMVIAELDRLAIERGVSRAAYVLAVLQEHLAEIGRPVVYEKPNGVKTLSTAAANYNG
jgi:hypothetical protein